MITPRTKIGELLDNYPQLESVLLDLSPAFAKLKNPVLRKTVARVATLQQAAVIGNLKTDELVNTLRKEIGQDSLNEPEEHSVYLAQKLPDDFEKKQIVIRFDATVTINSGGSPMNEILSKAHQLKEGEILELKTPFVPAPVIDMLKNKGYRVTSVQKKPNEIFSYILR